MKQNLYNKFKKKLFLFMLCVLIVASPISVNLQTQKALAILDIFGGLGGLQIVKDPQSIITQTLHAASTAALEMKELFTDGLAFDIAQKALKQMLGNLINSVNTGGQNVNGEADGSAQFVTNLGDHMQAVADQRAGEILYGEWGATCQTNTDALRATLVAQYREERAGGTQAGGTGAGAQNACIYGDDFVDQLDSLQAGVFNGDWTLFLKIALDPSVSRLGGDIEKKQQLNTAIRSAQEEELEVLRWNDGFKATKTCTNINTPLGQRLHCNATSHGGVVKDLYTKALGTGIDSLLNADELNEVIGGLFANLADQAISGINGMVGLSDNAFGSDGTKNYLDAILEEHNNKPQITQDRKNPVQQSFETEVAVAQSEDDIVRAISDITQCQPDIVLPQLLQDTLAEYQDRVLETLSVILQLQQMSEEYASTTSSERKQEILSKRQLMISDGEVKGSAVLLENQSTLSTLQSIIADFKDDINYVDIDCDIQ